MSALIVHDVTSATQTTAAGTVSKKQQTTITPFQKVLAQEEELYSGRTESSKTEGTSQAKKTSLKSTKKGETTLQDIFERAAEKYDISYDFLVAVAKAESDFNPNCVSSAGAQGIMQVMPAEQKGLGIKDPFDAEQNIMGAAKLLKAHLKKFDGDYTLAAAAYNAGSGTVKKYGGVPPYTETQNYVKKINKYMKEGVTVPDKKVKVSSQDSTVGSGGSDGTSDTKKTITDFDEGKAATDADMEKITVAVGTGDNTVTMSYGAYLKYLELGSAGVG